MTDINFDHYKDINFLWHDFCVNTRENRRIKCVQYGKCRNIAPNLIDGNAWLEVGLCVNKLMIDKIWDGKFCFFMYNKGIQGIPQGKLYMRGLNQLAEVLYRKGLISVRQYYE